jgi:hypothetical protein
MTRSHAHQGIFDSRQTEGFMKQSRFIVSVVLISALAAGSVSAQQVGASGAPPARSGVSASPAPPQANDGANGAPAFGDLDKDNKGYITRKDVPKDVERLKPLRAHFPEADMNHDGKVDKSEYDAYINKSTSPQR